jgi:hypothetical protein
MWMAISTMDVRCCEKPGKGASAFKRSVAAWRSVDEVVAIAGAADLIWPLSILLEQFAIGLSW